MSRVTTRAGGPWRPLAAPLRTASRMPAGARGSNVFARKGTRTQTYFVPGP